MVEIKDVAKGTTQSGKTDKEGVYQFPLMLWSNSTMVSFGQLTVAVNSPQLQAPLSSAQSTADDERLTSPGDSPCFRATTELPADVRSIPEASPYPQSSFRSDAPRIMAPLYYFGVTVRTAEVVSTTVLFMTVDSVTVKLPGQAHLGIRTGSEKFWEVFGGNANGGVWNITDSAVPQLPGWSGPVSLKSSETTCVLFEHELIVPFILVVPPCGTLEGDRVIDT